MKEYFDFRGHFAIVFELLDVNLYKWIHNTQIHVRKQKIIPIAKQILDGLIQLKQSQVIHCDLKPENILFTDASQNHLKIIDLGSACRRFEEGFTYVQSRFYRSPEIVLGLPYDHQVDMWSFGCILVELVTGEPLFPAADENDLLAYIKMRIGEPSMPMIQQAQKRNQFYYFDGQ